MKRCPECYAAYVDSEKFCELDGSTLLVDPAVMATSVDDDGPIAREGSPRLSLNQHNQQREVWFVAVAGVLAGIVVCVGGYLAYGLFNAESGHKEPAAPAYVSRNPEPITLTPRPQAPRPETTPSPEATLPPENDASPEPQPSPTAETSTVAARLNQGPVSTGQRRKDSQDTAAVQTIIELNDGSAIEVDAAWEDSQGVWYRRGGMVAFVESQRVKAITGRAAQKPSSQ